MPDYRLACLTAPAGYGKTTAVTDYLKKQNIKYAWFSVDEADNNPVRFWRYFTASIIEISVHSFINTIINMIERTRVNFVLVLDEYHVITNNIVLSSVEYFIKYMPQNISVIIISRKYPDNMLSVMCSRGMAIHIGMKEGYTRTFVDEVHPMAALLGKYITAKRNSKYLVYAKNLFRRTNEYIKLLEGDCKVNKKECENVDFLFISVSTVKQHNSRIYDKPGVKNRVEAIIRAKEMGFRELHENCTFDSTSG